MSYTLDAALHHFDTLHVDDLIHAPSAVPGSTHRQLSFSTLGRMFHMELEWDTHILAEDFAVYSVDSAGRKEHHNIDKKAFLRGHLRGESVHVASLLIPTPCLQMRSIRPWSLPTCPVMVY